MIPVPQKLVQMWPVFLLQGSTHLGTELYIAGLTDMAANQFEAQVYRNNFV